MRTIFRSLTIFLAFTVLTGIVYPLLITAIVQVCFPGKANGSLITVNGKEVGSSLIGQQSDSSIYFSSRPSAVLYNPLPSGGTNYGLTNSKLKQLVNERKKHFIAINGLDSLTTIPSEMLFASASGLDPHISPEAAHLQAERVAHARNFNLKQKQKLFELIDAQTEAPQFLCLGEKRVNVLLLNLEIDKIK